MPLVGTGRGGAAKRAGDVASELLPALEEKAAQHDVDVALVMLDANAFAAVQAARRRAHASGFHELGEELQAEARRLATLANVVNWCCFLVLVSGSPPDYRTGRACWTAGPKGRDVR